MRLYTFRETFTYKKYLNDFRETIHSTNIYVINVTKVILSNIQNWHVYGSSIKGGYSRLVFLTVSSRQKNNRYVSGKSIVQTAT